MYERFTDRCRKVMQRASQEAKRFNHEYIGTEHILLGLLRSNGVAANVLKNFDVDLTKVRSEVEKRMKPDSDVVVMGKLPQTPLARKVIEKAIECARVYHFNYVGTEHLLLGCLSAGGIAQDVLFVCGVTFDSARDEIFNLLGWSEGKPPEPEVKQGACDCFQTPAMWTFTIHGLDCTTNCCSANEVNPDETERLRKQFDLTAASGCKIDPYPIGAASYYKAKIDSVCALIDAGATTLSEVREMLRGEAGLMKAELPIVRSKSALHSETKDAYRAVAAVEEGNDKITCIPWTPVFEILQEAPSLPTLDEASVGQLEGAVAFLKETASGVAKDEPKKEEEPAKVKWREFL